MHLIQVNEPTSINIKNNMSTLGETIENNQINGAIVDKRIDICGKKSPSKNDTDPITGEHINEDNPTKEQINDAVKDLNGIAKTNGDAQTLSVNCNKIKTEANIDNGSAAKSQSNGTSSCSESCKTTNCNTCDIDNTTTDNTVLQNPTNNLNVEVILSEKEAVTVDQEKTDEKEIIKSSNENIPEMVEAQAVASSVETSDAENIKSIKISIETDVVAPNESAFSPTSDTNEEINISAQLQQLENDASMEYNSKNSFTGSISATNQSNTSENKSIQNDASIEATNHCNISENGSLEIDASIGNDSKTLTDGNNLVKSEDSTYTSDDQHKIVEYKPASPVNNKENVVVIKQTEKKEISKSSELGAVKLSVEKTDENIVLEMDIEKTPTNDKPETSLDISLKETLSIENKTKDKNSMDVVSENASMDVVSEDVIDNTNNVNEKKDVPDVAAAICTGDIDMEVDNRNQIDEQNLESINSKDASVEKEPSVQKYVTVKKLTDMVYPVAPTATENIEASEILDDQLAQIDHNHQNEVMEVDDSEKTSLISNDDSVCLKTADKQLLVQTTEDENNVTMENKKIIQDKAMEEVNEVSKEKQAMTIKPQGTDNDVMEIESSDIEINNSDEVPIIEKSVLVEKDEIEKTASDVKVCEKTNAVINIIDNDDEDIKMSTREYSVENSVESDVISIDDNVKSTISEEFHKPSSEIEFVNEEKNKQNDAKLPETIPETSVLKQLPVCKLSNTMDILSDEEDDLAVKPSKENKIVNNTPNSVEEENKCINIDDDDDIMLIEDTNSQDTNLEAGNSSEQQSDKVESQPIKTTDILIEPNSSENKVNSPKLPEDDEPKVCKKDCTASIAVDIQPKVKEPKPVKTIETQETKPLITKSFLKSVSKNLADMTRNELEDFCILKLVESVVDKSNLNEIKNKMKTMAQTVEDLRKKAVALTKQNRDLQVVVKTVQEDQKKKNSNPMMPMKITRSVGMQVVLSVGEKSMLLKKKLSTPVQPPAIVPNRPVRNIQSPKTPKPVANNIPVPRLVPASSPTIKSPVTPVITTKPAVTVTPARTAPQRPEKRPHSKQSPSSVTVDLTDDEPPAKIIPKNPAPPVRLVPSQSLMPPKNKPQFAQAGNSPRKVYIPISSSNPNPRLPPPSAGPTVIKNFVTAPRHRQPSVVRMQTLRVSQLPPTTRHPASLPDAMKQYQPSTWKALPPAPDLKLSKVDNGIVISWKFEGYQPDTYEEVASFQLYAYQETTAPPSTALWKKIGDIKALPLPMACTLTQFMSGFKYYFAVRAIDVRSRIGPFSLPGSILLIAKN